MLAAILPILSIAAEVVPFLTDSATISRIVNAVVTLAPAVINTVEGGTQAVKNIVKGLKENEAITEADWNALDAYEAKIDADWAAAKAKAQAEDAAAKK